MDDNKNYDLGSVDRNIILLRLFGLFTLLLTLSFIGYGIVFPEKYIDHGPWGDFLGGTLNPVLTTLTFLAVLATLYYQRLELFLTRKELAASTVELEKSAKALENQISESRIQTFEASFFDFLSLRNEIMKAVLVRYTFRGRTSNVYEGGEAFYRMISEFKDCFVKASEEIDGDIIKILRKSFEYFWDHNKKNLNNYFRCTYSIMKFIDNGSNNKPYHFSLFRDMISDQEMAVIFYYYLSRIDINFNEMAERFKFFDDYEGDFLMGKEYLEFVRVKENT